MNRLEALRQANPDLTLIPVTDPAFAPYGCLWAGAETDAILDACLKLPMPPSGSHYVAKEPTLEALPQAQALMARYLGGVAAETGFCWGYSSNLNALEWHKSSEVNIAVTDLVLLLADLRQLEGGWLDSDKIKAFYVPQGTVLEVYQTTLHFCPCMVDETGFRSVVILPRETNEPLVAPGEPLLWRQNKWLIAHKANNSLLQRGVVPGIRGVNLHVNII